MTQVELMAQRRETMTAELVLRVQEFLMDYDTSVAHNMWIEAKRRLDHMDLGDDEAPSRAYAAL